MRKHFIIAALLLAGAGTSCQRDPYAPYDERIRCYNNGAVVYQAEGITTEVTSLNYIRVHFPSRTEWVVNMPCIVTPIPVKGENE